MGKQLAIPGTEIEVWEMLVNGHPSPVYLSQNEVKGKRGAERIFEKFYRGNGPFKRLVKRGRAYQAPDVNIGARRMNSIPDHIQKKYVRKQYGLGKGNKKVYLITFSLPIPNI
jgi:hypothetical protein